MSSRGPGPCRPVATDRGNSPLSSCPQSASSLQTHSQARWTSAQNPNEPLGESQSPLQRIRPHDYVFCQRYFNLCTVSKVTFLKASMLLIKRLVVSTLKVVRVLFSGPVPSLSCFSSVLFESLYSNSYIISVAERKAEQPSLLTCELTLTPSTFSSNSSSSL